MLASLFKVAALNETRDPRAANEFLAGWVYGVSHQTVNIRFEMEDCFIKSEELTNTVYDAMDAWKAGDMQKVQDEWAKTGPMYTTALAKCPKDTVQDPIEEWSKKVTDMSQASDWPTQEKDIYEKNKKEIDDNTKEEFYFWFDKPTWFNSGMYAGRTDKIFLDATTPKFFHPFF